MLKAIKQSNTANVFFNIDVGNLSVKPAPIFEVKNNQDNEVYELFKQIFPDRKIETLNFNSVGLFGGVLNCTTWTINE